MTPWAFISRHAPTSRQFELARDAGVDLYWIGDADGFTVNHEDVKSKFSLEEMDGHIDFDGVVVVHAAAAMNLARYYKIGVFENANRAPEGERPQFEAKALHLYQ